MSQSPPQRPLRVVIGEDELLLREGLRLMLAELGMTVAAATADAEELLQLVDTHRPGLVVVDIRMPPHLLDDGLRAALRIRREHPACPVLVLSHHVQRRYALALLDAGPDGIGYLLKQRVLDLDRFAADLQTVATGGTVIDPLVVETALVGASTDPALQRLTARQLQVVDLLAQGRSNAAIAAELGISERAVKDHTANIYAGLSLADHPDDHRRVLAVLRYLSR